MRSPVERNLPVSSNALVHPGENLSNLGVYSECPYGGSFRRVLLAVKESGRSDAIPMLSELLAVVLVRALGAQLDERRIYAVPMPSTATSERRRGFRHVSLMLRSAAGRVRDAEGKRIVVRGWLRVRRWGRLRRWLLGGRLWGSARADQVGLSRYDRYRNVNDTLIANRRCRGRRIVIVDDLITTGASLREAHRALSERGGCVLSAVSLGYTPKRRG